MIPNYLLVILIIPAILFAQVDSSKNLDSVISHQAFQSKNDTAETKEKPYSILHLKSLLDIKLNNLSLINPVHESFDESIIFYNFTKEELNSGLSKKELIAYKKNKEAFFNILDSEYEKCWWYKVKSLGQLIGISDWVIKALEFSLLLL